MVPVSLQARPGNRINECLSPVSTRLPSAAGMLVAMHTRSTAIAPFHLAFPVRDLVSTRAFYGGLLACPEGRSSSEWIDFDLFGHQIVAHLAPLKSDAGPHHNPVDGHDVPVPHFGVVLDWDDFHALAGRLRDGGMKFVIDPYIRFAGQVGEQATMFFYDPSGNALEFKAFRDRSQLFAK
jgi:uncharacterized protein